ncbi:hypothetical protein ACFWWT_47345 [Streptomyces sp. NPDC058676]|uniref:hypothetical protein n=1 Tax=Streptomyces sp. NPDC058676 TaxID=3346593 RepID=UPI003646229F
MGREFGADAAAKAMSLADFATYLLQVEFDAQEHTALVLSEIAKTSPDFEVCRDDLISTYAEYGDDLISTYAEYGDDLISTYAEYGLATPAQRASEVAQGIPPRRPGNEVQREP